MIIKINNKIKMEKKLKKLKEKGSKLRKEILKRLSIEDFKLFLKWDMNEFKINLLENDIKRENIFIELKGGIKKMEQTKEQRKEMALKEYLKIQNPAWKEFKKIKNPAWEEYKKIVNPAYKEYEKKIKEIDDEPEE